MVERNLSGSLANFNAVRAVLLPRLASASSRDFLADTRAISDIDKVPFKMIRIRIMIISIN